MKYHRSNDKRPRERRMISREHYVRKGVGWKPKMSFADEAMAHDWLVGHVYFRENGYCVYECSVCHLWHIGRLRDYRKFDEDTI